MIGWYIPNDSPKTLTLGWMLCALRNPVDEILSTLHTGPTIITIRFFLKYFLIDKACRSCRFHAWNKKK